VRATPPACYVASVHPTQPGQGEFARLLASIQERAGLSYQQVADAAGVNRSQVWRWVNTGSAPGYEPVRLLAAHLIAAHPQLADDAAKLLPAAGYQIPPVTVEHAAAPEQPSETPAADSGDDVTGAVVAALFGPKERKIWAHIRRTLEATPAGAKLFADPDQSAVWPPESPDGFSGGAPFDLTEKARKLLDATPAEALFTDHVEITVWHLVRTPYRKRVGMIREYREPVRPPRAARRAG
jgi:transcriptional regulator with XRE-family HTH domain